MAQPSTKRTRRGRSTYKGDRELVGVRVPASVHSELMAIKEVTGVAISDQLVDLVSAYARETLAELEAVQPRALFEEAAVRLA